MFSSFKTAYFLSLMDLSSRFRTAKLGIHWFYIQQIVWALGAGTVWSIVFRIPLEQFLPFIVVSFNTWTFLSSFFVDASAAFQNAAGYLKNTTTPAKSYVNKNFISATIVLMISFIPLLIMVPFVSDEYLNISPLKTLVSILFIIICFAQVSYVIAFIGVMIRDLTPAIQSFFQVLFIASPVIYPPDLIKEKGYDWALNYNPFYHSLEIVRSPILTGSFASIENFSVVLGIGISFFILYLLFLKNRYKFVALHV